MLWTTKRCRIDGVGRSRSSYIRTEASNGIPLAPPRTLFGYHSYFFLCPQDRRSKYFLSNRACTTDTSYIAAGPIHIGREAHPIIRRSWAPHRTGTAPPLPLVPRPEEHPPRQHQQHRRSTSTPPRCPLQPPLSAISCVAPPPPARLMTSSPSSPMRLPASGLGSLE